MRPRNISILIIVLAFMSACTGSGKKPVIDGVEESPKWLEGDTVSNIEGEIRGIFQDAKNNLWFASNGNGVYKYDGKTIVNFNEKHGLASNYVWMVKEGKDGNMWFKTNVHSVGEDAICRFDGHGFRTIGSGHNRIEYNFQSGDLLFDYYYDGSLLSKIQLPHNSPIKNESNERYHYDIYATCQDKNGNVWFGTCTAGICRYDGKTYEWFDNKELGSAIRCIFEDKNGIIWVGNNGDGLFRYDGNDFINFSRERNLHNPDFEKYPTGKPGLLSRVWTIAEDKDGKLWAGTIDNGAWFIDGKTTRNYTEKDGLAIDAIWTIYKDRQGNLWFGTEGDGVYTFNGTTFEKFAP